MCSNQKNLPKALKLCLKDNILLDPVFSETNKKENNAKRIGFIQEKLVELEKTN